MVGISSPANIKDQNAWAGNQLNKKLSEVSSLGLKWGNKPTRLKRSIQSKQITHSY